MNVSSLPQSSAFTTIDLQLSPSGEDSFVDGDEEEEEEEEEEE